MTSFFFLTSFILLMLSIISNIKFPRFCKTKSLIIFAFISLKYLMHVNIFKKTILNCFIKFVIFISYFDKYLKDLINILFNFPLISFLVKNLIPFFSLFFNK